MNAKRAPKIEVLYGIHSVLEALSAGRREFHAIYVNRDSRNKRIEKIAEKARQKQIPVEPLSLEALQKVTGSTKHQDVAARTSIFPAVGFERLLSDDQKTGGRSFFLVLDSVVDPQNLGGIIRTAVCAGVSGIIIPRDRAAAPTPAVSRASAGALEHASLCIVTNLANAMKDLKKSGFWIIGLDQHGDQSIYAVDLTGRQALVIGGEDTGIRPLVKRQCDFLCFIPQSGPINSLNASVAGGIAIYEAYRQRMWEGTKT